MWLEAIFSEQDFEHVLRDLTPVTIALGTDGELHLDRPTAVSLVPGQGLRLTCHIGLRWSVLGLHVPFTIESATVLLELAIVKGGPADLLAFKVKLEDLDVSVLPHMFAESAVALVNKELESHHAALAWDFKKTLDARFDLPAVLTPRRGMHLAAAWAEARISSDAVVLAVSVHLTAEPARSRALATVPVQPATEATARALTARRAARRLAIGSAATALTASVIGLVVGISLARRRRPSVLSLGSWR